MVSDLAKHAARISTFAGEFWVRFNEGRGKEGRFPLVPNSFARESRSGEIEPTVLGEAYFQLDNALARLETAADVYSDDIPEAESLVRRLRQTRFDLEFVVSQAESHFVYWLERRGRGVFLRASPIDVSDLLHEKTFRQGGNLRHDFGYAFK